MNREDAYARTPVLEEMETTTAVHDGFSDQAGRAEGLGRDGKEARNEDAAGPGILVFSSTMGLLHVNPAAWSMLGHLTRFMNGQAASNRIPVSVMKLCHQLLESVQQKRNGKEAQEWWRFRASCVVGAPQYPVAFHALTIPGGGADQTHVLVLMDVMGGWGHAVSESMDRFTFTSRQADVVKHLLKGWTNKEIANALGITEQTVKEHIKHIMQKTGVTTRTGILARVLGLMKSCNGQDGVDRTAAMLS
jgi:DNA-binding CsgD family transcriptional regulator